MFICVRITKIKTEFINIYLLFSLLINLTGNLVVS